MQHVQTPFGSHVLHGSDRTTRSRAQHRTIMEQNGLCWAPVRQQPPEQNHVLLGASPVATRGAAPPTPGRLHRLVAWASSPVRRPRWADVRVGAEPRERCAPRAEASKRGRRPLTGVSGVSRPARVAHFAHRRGGALAVQRADESGGWGGLAACVRWNPKQFWLRSFTLRYRCL